MSNGIFLVLWDWLNFSINVHGVPLPALSKLVGTGWPGCWFENIFFHSCSVTYSLVTTGEYIFDIDIFYPISCTYIHANRNIALCYTTTGQFNTFFINKLQKEFYYSLICVCLKNSQLWLIFVTSDFSFLPMNRGTILILSLSKFEWIRLFYFTWEV